MLQKRHPAPCRPLTMCMLWPERCGVREAQLQAASFSTGRAPCGLGFSPPVAVPCACSDACTCRSAVLLWRLSCGAPSGGRRSWQPCTSA